MGIKFSKIFLIAISIVAVLFSKTFSQEHPKQIQQPVVKKLTLSNATMCEDIKDYTPQNCAVVFSISIGKVCSFSSFDQVFAQTFIYHTWYRSDKMVTKIKLFLQPPRWLTFSSIQLREADKGPWRVEISDQNSEIIKVLRFSITD